MPLPSIPNPGGKLVVRYICSLYPRPPLSLCRLAYMAIIPCGVLATENSTTLTCVEDKGFVENNRGWGGVRCRVGCLVFPNNDLGFVVRVCECALHCIHTGLTRRDDGASECKSIAWNRVSLC